MTGLGDLVGRGDLRGLESKSWDNEDPSEEDQRGERPPPEGRGGHLAIRRGVQKMKTKLVGRIIAPNRGWRPVMCPVLLNALCKSLTS